MSIDHTHPEFDRQFRDVLGSFCSGVTVITSISRGNPVGLTCQSFFSVSITPPLVAFSVAKTSSTFPAIRDATTCCVNMLSSDQSEISRSFGRSGTDKWQGIGWRQSPESGNPIIDGVLAWLDCRIEAEYDAGDHTLIVGRIQDMAVERAEAPLLFYRGAYLQLAGQ